jgi:hypothetical protein
MPLGTSWRENWCEFIFPCQPGQAHCRLAAIPRQPRSVADGPVYHALNRGKNRAGVFFLAADYQAILRALGLTQSRYPFQLFGFCLMGNRFQL